MSPKQELGEKILSGTCVLANFFPLYMDKPHQDFHPQPHIYAHHPYKLHIPATTMPSLVTRPL